jgi:hypothetical protein
MSAAEWIDMVFTSGRYWAGWVLAGGVGVSLMALAGWIYDETDSDWAAVPGIIGAILAFGYTGSIFLGIVSRLAIYVFTGQ